MPYTLTGYADRTYLHKVTAFMMMACRQENPLVGLWDVGDLQWWWRDDEYADPNAPGRGRSRWTHSCRVNLLG